MTNEKLTAFLQSCGLFCKIYKTKNAPKYKYIYFTIEDYKTFTPYNVKSAIYKLSAADGKQYYQTEELPQGANFGIYCACDNSTVLLSELPKSGHNQAEFIAGINQNGDNLKITMYDIVHCLIAGTTGSGKSVFLKSMIYQLLEYNTYFQYYIIDKKNSITYLADTPLCKGYAVDDNGTILALQRTKAEMYNRFEKMKICGIDNGKGYFPPLVVFIDELADLMLSARRNEIKDLLISIAQLGRAACIHLVICTQSPRVSVVDGLLLANIPTRIAFKTASARESVLILGHKGAENLLGKGDGLIKLPDKVNEIHFQAPFCEDKFIKEKLKELKQ